MKNITKRKDNRWQYRKQINKQRITIYAKSKEKLKEKIQQLNFIKTHIRKSNTSISLIDWCKKWKITYKDNFVSQGTQWNIKSFINHIEKSKLKNMDIKKIQTEDIQKYLNGMERTRSKEVITLYLNAVLNKAEKLKMIESNPCLNVIKERKIKNPRKAFNFDEQKIIFEKIRNTNIFAPIYTYLFTGIRRGELPKDIENSIKNNLLVIKSEKKRDDSSYRYIDITNKLKNLILNNKEQFKRTPRNIYDIFTNFLKENNIKGTIHNLRHTFTTNQLYLGTSEKFIQEWLGHNDINITKNTYMNIDRTLTKEKLLNLYGDYYYIINK